VDFTSDTSDLNTDPAPIAGTLTSNEKHPIWKSLAHLSPKDWTPCQPNLPLFYKWHAEGLFGTLSTSNVECHEEEVVFSSLKSNEEFDNQHSIMETHCKPFQHIPAVLPPCR